ncbi:MAG: apolipoprotein N-acyltransferase [Woeseiaceae bacterium]|jgi:apolipoprotein N-acyltransferase
MLEKINLTQFKFKLSYRMLFSFFLLGILLTSIFSPSNFYYLAPFVLVPVFYCCLKVPPKLSALYLFSFALGHFLTGVYWIYISVHSFGQAPIWIAIFLMLGLILLMASYFALAGWLISWWTNGRAFDLIFIGPSIWVLFEWLRSWMFSGFPWMTIGYSQVDTFLSGWAPVLGVFGVSWLVSISATIFLYFVLKKRYLLAILLMSMPYIMGFGLNLYSWSHSLGEPIKTTIIQGGVPQDLKWTADQFPKTLDLYLQATKNSPKNSFIVWPEVAIPASSDHIEEYLQFIQNEAKETNKKIALGVLEKNKDSGLLFNSMLFLDGITEQYYRKRHLVPFGEYFPVPSFIREWMRLQSLPNTDLSKGNQTQSLIKFSENIFLATAICYEVAFGSEQLYAFPDAALLVNISNDAWFGDSIAPHQHLQVSRMRSLEVGREMVRATNNGISAFIGSRGEVNQQSDQFVFAMLSADIQPRAGSTPYVLFGNWPILLLSGVILIFFYSFRMKNLKSAAN